MKKQLIFISILSIILFTQDIYGQCPQSNETVKLDGQSEVDDFLDSNPSCEFIEELELTGDVTDVSGFSSLKSLDNLYFTDCPLLTDISAFSNVDTIFNNLGFYDAMGFSDLCGLSSLRYLGQDLRLEETSGITALTGLESLETIADDITIFGNVDLESLDGLENVNSFGNDPTESHSIQVSGNPKLSNCCGVQTLYSLFTMENWEILNNASNCNSITEIENDDCTAATPSCIININELSIEAPIIAPNPSSDYIIISNVGSLEMTDIELMGMDGRLISKLTLNGDRLDLSNVKSGVYLLKMKVGNQLKTSKLVVSK